MTPQMLCNYATPQWSVMQLAFNAMLTFLLFSSVQPLGNKQPRPQ